MSTNSNDEIHCPYCQLHSARIERTNAGHRLHCALCGWSIPVDHEYDSHDEVGEDYVHVDDGDVDLNAAFGCPSCLQESAYVRGGSHSERIRIECTSCAWTGSIGEAQRLLMTLAAQDFAIN